jgi:CRP-like cAMP-binding protein
MRGEQSAHVTKHQSAVAISGVPLFSGFSKRHLQQLAARTDVVDYAPGDRIVEAGLLGEALFVILEGQAKVMRGGRRVATLVPGDFFGELSAIDGGPRTATVIAETPLRALRLFRRTLLKMLTSEPALGLKMLDEMVRRLRSMTGLPDLDA